MNAGAAAGPDQIAAAVAELQGRFPGTAVWFGVHTWHWWALVQCGEWRLVEALTPSELAHAIDKPGTWPWPSSMAWVGPG
jgi:hypothetical protein